MIHTVLPIPSTDTADGDVCSWPNLIASRAYGHALPELAATERRAAWQRLHGEEPDPNHRRPGRPKKFFGKQFIGIQFTRRTSHEA